MLQYDDGKPFTSSLTIYLDNMEGDPNNRICIYVKFSDLPATLAIVDTGAPFCVLNREQARAIDPEYRLNATENTKLVIRGHPTYGVLIRLPVTVCANKGVDVKVEGTIFVPDSDILMPNFIGLEGILNRIKFAIDPQKSHFFFGAY